MSITVIYKGKESKRTFSITISTFIFIITLLITGAWLLKFHFNQQLFQHKIKSINERNLINQQYLQATLPQDHQERRNLTAKIGQLQAQSNHLKTLNQHFIKQSMLPKEKFEFDINQYVSSSNRYPSVLSTKSELSSLHKNVEQLSNQRQNTQNHLEQLEITLNNLHLVNELFISGRSISKKVSWIFHYLAFAVILL